MDRFKKLLLSFCCLALLSTSALAQKKYSKKQIERLKNEASEIVMANAKQTQVMIDKVFSFAELGFQEFESSKYLTQILTDNGFEITESVSGIPTAWFAKWSNGDGPTIALGSDIDCIPKASQYPGVAYHKPMVEGAPGHGEGHNSGIPLNITAALEWCQNLSIVSSQIRGAPPNDQLILLQTLWLFLHHRSH